jgi:hypothetical protein
MTTPNTPSKEFENDCASVSEPVRAAALLIQKHFIGLLRFSERGPFFLSWVSTAEKQLNSIQS